MMHWLFRLAFVMRRAWLRAMVWGLDMDIAILEDRARRVLADRVDLTQRRSDLIIRLIDLDAERGG